MNIVSARQMQELDRRTVLDFGLDAQVLMELAGRCLSQWLYRQARGSKVAFLCGPGNNGGDGLVAARAWSDLGGQGQVFLLKADLQGEALRNLQRAQKWNLSIKSLEELQVEDFDWFVDALLGTGLSRNLELSCIADLPSERTLAVDIPSGICADTGQVLGQALKANTTITFGLPKLGQLLAPQYCGQLLVEAIGFPPQLLNDPDCPGQWLTPQLLRHYLPQSGPFSHKGNKGKVLVVAGSKRYPGAATLAASGALRSGAGLVYVYGPDKLRLPVEAIPLVAKGEYLGPEDVAAILQCLQQVDALCLGPGLGDHPQTLAAVGQILANNFLPAVVDADALAALPQQLSPRVLLTPHAGELARLLRMKAADLEKDRLRYTVQAARNFNCSVLFKGPATLVATPGGRYMVSTEATPVLAQGGSGDVLSGICATLLSQGLPSLEAGAVAAYIHGHAARLSEIKVGLGAEALSGYVPLALTKLLS